MSYEPTLLIIKKDLDKHNELLIDGVWQYQNNNKEEKGEEGLTVMEYIRDVYEKHKPIKIAGIELFLCTPTFSSFNKSVRKKLEELNVEFTVSY